MKAYSSSRHHHLAALDIPVLRLGLNQVYAYTIQHEARQLILVFDAQLAGDYPVSAEMDLVKAIVAALKIPASGGYFPQWRLPTVCPSVFVVLGEASSAYSSAYADYFSKATIFSTYSPAAILADSSLKAPVWQVLKQAMAVLTCPQSV
jgi:hypothetical protein